MQILLILCLIAIVAGFFIYPPLYLLCKKYKWVKWVKDMLLHLLAFNFFPLVLCIMILFVSYKEMNEWETFLYPPFSFAMLSTLLVSTIIFFWVEKLFEKKPVDDTEDNYQQTWYASIWLWTIFLAIPITYYIFQYCLVSN